MNITEKVAFLKGVMEGMKFDIESSEGNVISKLVDIVDDLAHALEDLDMKTDVTNDYVEELDHDLGELEEYVYDDDDIECGCCEDDDDCDCDCCDCDDDDDDLYEIECPHCHDKIYATEDMLKDSLNCPNCNEKICDIVVED